MAEARIDKWLWAVRLFKTRSAATEACKKGKVQVNGMATKPSRTIKENDMVSVRKNPVTYSFRVIRPIEKRVGAKLVPEMLEDVTPPEQKEILEITKISGFVNRAKGLGRPTKKERRELDEFTDPSFMDDFAWGMDDDEDEDDDTDYEDM